MSNYYEYRVCYYRNDYNINKMYEYNCQSDIERAKLELKRELQLPFISTAWIERREVSYSSWEKYKGSSIGANSA
jgi:hypothetical protein